MWSWDVGVDACVTSREGDEYSGLCQRTESQADVEN